MVEYSSIVDPKVEAAIVVSSLVECSEVNTAVVDICVEISPVVKGSVVDSNVEVKIDVL